MKYVLNVGWVICQKVVRCNINDKLTPRPCYSLPGLYKKLIQIAQSCYIK